MRLRPRSLLFAAALFILVVTLACFLVPPIFGLDPYRIDPAALYAPPSGTHPLGTDAAGRDFLARLLYGGRISLAVAVLTGILVVAVGATLGTLAGYYGGAIDAVVMRLVEANLAVPKLPLMLLFAAVDPARFMPGGREVTSVLGVTLVVGLFGWTTAARLARAAALRARTLDYVVAARALGLPERRILTHHVLPEAMSPLIVATMLSLGDVVLYESVLSFLGLGVQPPVPSWGAMLSRGLVDLALAPRLILLPGMLTFALVASFQLLGDGLREALDPRSVW